MPWLIESIEPGDRSDDRAQVAFFHLILCANSVTAGVNKVSHKGQTPHNNDSSQQSDSVNQG